MSFNNITFAPNFVGIGDPVQQLKVKTLYLLTIHFLLRKLSGSSNVVKITQNQSNFSNFIKGPCAK